MYIIRENGSGLTQLTNNAFDHIVMGWSPIGDWITFESSQKTEQFGNEIWIVRPDGTGLTNLSQDPARDDAPAWSPDSKHVAFVSNRDGVDQIYLLELASAHTQNVSNSGFNDLSPDWSPDGEHISFVSDRSGASELYVMNADGSAVVQLTRTQRGVQRAIWSPVGNQIAFVVNDEIWVINSDGTDQRKLSGDLFASLPAWSPDGGFIAFQGIDIHDFNDNHFDVYWARAGGNTLTKITDGSREYALGTWAPDSEWLILLAGDTIGNVRMYRVRRDGSEFEPLDNAPDQRIVSVTWQP